MISFFCEEILRKMHFWNLLFLLCITQDCCAGSQDISAMPDGLCKKIYQFSETVNIGQIRSVSLAISHTNGAFGAKTCTASAMDKPEREFCEWLSRNTSNEFMAQNISRAIACIANTKAFSGKSNIDIDFEYNFGNLSSMPEDFFTITVRGVDNSD